MECRRFFEGRKAETATMQLVTERSKRSIVPIPRQAPEWLTCIRIAERVLHQYYKLQKET